MRNTGSSTVPNVAVTIDSFDYTSSYPELAADKRPVWVIERGPGAIASPPVESEQVSPPGGGQTAYVNTWALGALAPGATRTFVWRVVPVKAGSYTVHYTVAAGLAGKSKAQLSSGGPVRGQFAVYIASAPGSRTSTRRPVASKLGQYPAISSQIARSRVRAAGATPADSVAYAPQARPRRLMEVIADRRSRLPTSCSADARCLADCRNRTPFDFASR